MIGITKLFSLFFRIFPWLVAGVSLAYVLYTFEEKGSLEEKVKELTVKVETLEKELDKCKKSKAKKIKEVVKRVVVVKKRCNEMLNLKKSLERKVNEVKEKKFPPKEDPILTELNSLWSK